jgi:hypothetical protein
VKRGGQQMPRAVCAAAAVVGIVTPFTASAWEADGFRAGMTLAQAMAVTLSHGEGILGRFETPGIRGGPRNAYMVQLKRKAGWDSHGPKLASGETNSGRLIFCSDVLYAYDRYLPGGFEAFVTSTEREARQRGAPTLQSFSGASMSISASWSAGSDGPSFDLEKFDGQFYFSRSHEDPSVCPK